MVKWSIAHKLTLIGLILMAIGIIVSVIVKIDIKVNTLQDKVDELEIKTANIGNLTADNIFTNGISSVCPIGQKASTMIRDGKVEFICQ